MRNSYVHSRSPIHRDIFFSLFLPLPLLWWGARTCEVSGWPEIVAMSKYEYAKVMIELIRLYILMVPFNLLLYFIKKILFQIDRNRNSVCIYYKISLSACVMKGTSMD